MSDLNNIGKIGGNVSKNTELPNKKEDLNLNLSQNEAENTLSEIPSSASVIGRSMVSQDNVNNDIAFGIKNPQVLQKCESFFDSVYTELSNSKDPEAYEKACMLTSAFAKEISQ